jgi:hypothetical protein
LDVAVDRRLGRPGHVISSVFLWLVVITASRRSSLVFHYRWGPCRRAPFRRSRRWWGLDAALEHELARWARIRAVVPESCSASAVIVASSRQQESRVFLQPVPHSARLASGHSFDEVVAGPRRTRSPARIRGTPLTLQRRRYPDFSSARPRCWFSSWRAAGRRSVAGRGGSSRTEAATRRGCLG